MLLTQVYLKHLHQLLTFDTHICHWSSSVLTAAVYGA